MFNRLGSFVAKHWMVVLLGWIALATLMCYKAPRWDDITRDGDFVYLPSSMKSIQADRLMKEAFPDYVSQSLVIIVVARRDGPLQTVDFDVADWFAEHFTPEQQTPGPVVEILTHQTPVVGDKLISDIGPKGQTTLVVLRLRNEFMAEDNKALVRQIIQTMQSLQDRNDFPEGLQLGVTGSATIGSDMLFAVDESVYSTEHATVLLVVIILLIVYRAPGLLIVPITTIIASLVVALGLVALLTQLSEQLGWLDYRIFKTTRIFVVVVLWGAGTDFCLFLISRYREGVNQGQEPMAALAQALGRVGSTVTASAMTTILGLGMMVFCSFGKFNSSGPTVAISLAVTLVASLTLAPALLRAAGWIVFWPYTQPTRTAKGAAGIFEHPSTSSDQTQSIDSKMSRFWEWFTRANLSRPGLVLLVSLLLLAPLAYCGRSVNITFDFLSELPPDRPSVQGTRLLRDYFPAGRSGPVELLAYRASGGFDKGPVLYQQIRELNQYLEQFTYTDAHGVIIHPIINIRSLVDPLGDQPQRFGGRDALLHGIIRNRAKGSFLSQSPTYAGKVVRFELVCAYDPFSRESIRLLDHLEQQLVRLAANPNSPWHGTTFHFAGPTAQIRDLEIVTNTDTRRIQVLVPIVVLAVLILLLRKLIISVFLVLSVLFGYYVSLGFTGLLFGWLRGQDYIGLDWKVPMFLFVLLVALGEDYNIYLVSRVAEEQKRLGFHRGLHFAVVRTGGIITSCGLIMAGTFASMITGTLTAIQELGVALSFGVLLDTLVIRTILVPAFIAVWHRLCCRFTAHGDIPDDRSAP